MKTLVITLVLSFITSLSFAQFPQSDSPDSCCYISDDLRVAIFMDQEPLVNVKIAKHPGELIKVRVKENNKILYLDRIKSHEIVNLKYDISQFPKGDYVFEVIKDKKVVFTQTVRLGEAAENFALLK